jgi:ABC-type multidrug transport system fused ATPase/permease subunit
MATGGLFGPLRARDRAIIDEAIARVGLTQRASSSIQTLSGGQQQRAFIAKALAAEPSLLVLDEPTSGVDVEAQENLAELLARLHVELGTTIVYVSHEFGAGRALRRAPAARSRRDRLRRPADRSARASGTTPRTFMFESEFMRLAFAAGAVIGVLAPAVGFFLVQRRMSLIGDGIGHVAFAGVAAGLLLGISPVLTALVFAVVGGVAIEWLRAQRHTAGDQALALVFYTGIAGGSCSSRSPDRSTSTSFNISSGRS